MTPLLGSCSLRAWHSWMHLSAPREERVLIFFEAGLASFHQLFYTHSGLCYPYAAPRKLPLCESGGVSPVIRNLNFGGGEYQHHHDRQYHYACILKNTKAPSAVDHDVLPCTRCETSTIFRNSCSLGPIYCPQPMCLEVVPPVARIFWVPSRSNLPKPSSMGIGRCENPAVEI